MVVIVFLDVVESVDCVVDLLIVVNVYLFWLSFHILSFLFVCSHRGSLFLCHHYIAYELRLERGYSHTLYKTKNEHGYVVVLLGKRNSNCVCVVCLRRVSVMMCVSEECVAEEASTGFIGEPQSGRL